MNHLLSRSSARVVLAAFAVGALSVVTLGAATPVVAAPTDAEGCGTIAEGSELSRVGNVCQIAFTTPGEYSWTVPSGLSTLHAVVTGAGGDAFVVDTAVGFAGDGGKVLYVDLSSLDPGTTVDMFVGNVDSDGDPGDLSALRVGEVFLVDGEVIGEIFVADGGLNGSNDDGRECFVPGAELLLANGVGASGILPAPDGGDCADNVSSGVRPAIDADSYGNEPLALFETFEGELGSGGRVIVDDGSPLGAQFGGTGSGGDVIVTASRVSDVDTEADNGSVIIRYAVAEADEDSGASPTPGHETENEKSPTPELARTGAEAGSLAVVAAGFLSLGALALMMRRRVRATYAH